MPREHVLDVDVHLLDALIGDDFKGRHRALAHFHVHHALVELAFAKLRAKFFARAVGLFPACVRPRDSAVLGCRAVPAEGGSKQIQHAFFGGLFGAIGNFVQFFLAHHVDGRFHQIADHGFHVAAHVADFGVLRRFHLHERAARQARKAARNFRLAHAGRPDHQNILGQNIFGHFGRKLLAAHAVAQGDGDGALCGGLPDDVFVELDDDFARRHARRTREEALRLRRARLPLPPGQDDLFVRLVAMNVCSSCLCRQR